MPRNEPISSDRRQASDETAREHQGQNNMERGSEDHPTGEARDAGRVPGQQTGRGEQQQREPWRKPKVGSSAAGQAQKAGRPDANDKEAAR